MTPRRLPRQHRRSQRSAHHRPRVLRAKSVFLEFVTDLMLDIIWTGHPHLPVEIHVSGPNSLLLERDADGRIGAVTHRGARVCADLETDHMVIIREECRRPSWVYNGDLRSGRHDWEELR